MNLSVMALSGGMDSTCLLLRLIAEGDEVIALSFRYGQRHVLELECAKRTVQMLRERGHTIDHRILDLEDAMGRFSNALTDHATSMPEGHYEELGMRATVVPNRNAIFASLLYGTALDHIDREGYVRVSLGVHSGDPRSTPTADLISISHWNKPSESGIGVRRTWHSIYRTSRWTRRASCKMP